MIIEPMIVTDKIGRSIVLRNAEEDDAASLIKFMKITTGETPFLIREPDEFSLTIEHEKFELETFDNVLIRKLIECVKVLSKTEILVIFKGGYEVRTEIE